MKLRFSLLMVAALAASFLSAGCKTARVNPVTGQTEKVYDPAKTEKVEAALVVPISSGLRRVLKAVPDKAPQIVKYSQAVGHIFCKMDSEKTFDPLFLVAEMDKLAPDLSKITGGNTEAAETIVDVKNSLIALYKISYADRFRAEIPADQWVAAVANIFCNAIDTGLKDAGYAGAKGAL